MTFTQRLVAVDVHAEGEPGRVITEGMPELPPGTMLQKMQWLEANADHIRLQMLREPRGYPGLCCNAIVPSDDPRADAGFIIMEQTEYAPMSGSNTICVVTALLETGLLPMVEPVTTLTLEAPAGLIEVVAECSNGKVTRVRFQNVPSFVMHLDLPIEVPELGMVPVDIAWGGMFYAIADADALGVDLSAANGAEIARVSEMIRVATVEQNPVEHPVLRGLTGPTISQLHGAPSVPGAHRRNAVTLATGELDWSRPTTWTGALDRCPCGTGTAAAMAVLHARGQLEVGAPFVHEGPLGTTFTGQILEETTINGPSIEETSISGPSIDGPSSTSAGDAWSSELKSEGPSNTSSREGQSGGSNSDGRSRGSNSERKSEGSRSVGPATAADEAPEVGEIVAIVPEIGGQGWITGTGEYLLDETDPFPNGYTIGDIWP